MNGGLSTKILREAIEAGRKAESKASAEDVWEGSTREGIRYLHRPVRDLIGLVVCGECSCGPHGRIWPCTTAKMVYSESELN